MSLGIGWCWGGPLDCERGYSVGHPHQLPIIENVGMVGLPLVDFSPEQNPIGFVLGIP